MASQDPTPASPSPEKIRQAFVPPEKPKTGSQTGPLLDSPSLVPPGLSPAAPRGGGDQGEKQHNLRFYILAVCFLWGMALGFLYHISQDETPPAIEEEEDEPAGPAALAEVRDLPEAFRPKTDVPAPPAQNKPDSDSPIPEDEAGSIIRELEKDLGGKTRVSAFDPSSAALAPLPKEPYGGLTGQNALLPSFARRKEQPLVPIEPGEGPELQWGSSDIAGPELELD